MIEQALRLSPAFMGWPESILARLLAASQMGRYARGEMIGTEKSSGEALLVVSGRILVSRISGAEIRTPLLLIGPGTLAGFSCELGFEDDSVYDFTALDDVVAVRAPVSVISEGLREMPALWRDMGLMLLSQQREMLNTLMKQLLGPLPKRLAATLERLATLYGGRKNGAPGIRIGLTQAELASILHVTRQSVNKELGRLVELKVVSLDYNSIIVLDMAELRMIAAGP